MTFCPKSIILMTGAKFHGKDSFAWHLTDRYGYTRHAFADALKACAAAALGCDVSLFSAPSTKEKPIPGYENWTYRSFLEDLGTAYFRHKFPGIWVNTVITKIATSHADRVIVTDCRFDDEVKKIMSAFPAAKVRMVNIIDPDRPEELDGHYEPYDALKASALFYADTNKTKLVPADEIHIPIPKADALDRFRTFAGKIAHVSAWNYRTFRPDFVVVNNGTLDDLGTAASALYSKLEAL